MTVEDEAERSEFNELALVEMGVSLASWHAMTGGERIGLVSRFVSSRRALAARRVTCSASR